jgi:hypothetical protein
MNFGIVSFRMLKDLTSFFFFATFILSLIIMKHIILIFGLVILFYNSGIAQHKDATTAPHITPDYIMLKQTFWGSWKVIHVDKPKKKLHKWYYDSKTDTYYRMKIWLGIYCRMKS